MALTATDLFNDATTRMVGGIGPDQVDKIVADLTAVQQMLGAASPHNDLSNLHTQIIVNQLNEEIASVQGLTSGTPILDTNLGQYVGRSINDIHRDIIDIAQGDVGVRAIFNPTPLPDLATPPAPFQDDTIQTTFLTQFILDSSHLGQMATTIANDHFNGDIAGLVQQIETFAANASAFDQSQGELYSARFWNELRSDGTAGTAANALIEGLQTHNAGQVSAATEQLATNAADLASNNLKADHTTYDDVVAVAEATVVTTTTASTVAPTSAPVADSTPPAQSTTPATAGGAEIAATASADAGHHAVARIGDLAGPCFTEHLAHAWRSNRRCARPAGRSADRHHRRTGNPTRHPVRRQSRHGVPADHGDPREGRRLRPLDLHRPLGIPDPCRGRKGYPVDGQGSLAAPADRDDDSSNRTCRGSRRRAIAPREGELT